MLKRKLLNSIKKIFQKNILESLFPPFTPTSSNFPAAIHSKTPPEHMQGSSPVFPPPLLTRPLQTGACQLMLVSLNHKSIDSARDGGKFPGLRYLQDFPQPWLCPQISVSLYTHMALILHGFPVLY